MVPVQEGIELARRTMSTTADTGERHRRGIGRRL